MQSYQTEISSSAEKEKIRHDTMLRLMVTGIFTALAIEILYIYIAWQTGIWQYKTLTGINGVLTASLIFISLLAWYKKNIAAAWLTILTIDILFPIVSVFFGGLGAILATGALAISTLTALLSLPRRNFWTISAINIVSFTATILIEFFYHIPDRLQVELLIQEIIIVILGIFLLVYGVYAFNLISSNSIHARLRRIFFITVFAPVLMSSIPLILSFRQATIDNANQLIYIAAKQTADKVDSFFYENLDDIQADAHTPSIVHYLKGSGNKQNILEILAVFRLNHPEATSYALLDADGLNQIDTRMGENHTVVSEAGAPYFQGVLESGKPYISDILFDPQKGKPKIYLAAPVFDEQNHILGVLRVEYEAETLQNIIGSQNELIGAASFAVLLDENHTIIGHGADANSLYRDIPQSADIEKGIAHIDTTPYFSLELESDDRTGGDDKAAAVRMSSKPWVTIYAQQGEVFSQPLQRQIQSSLILLSVLLLGVFIIANISTNLLVNPIIQLTEFAKQIKTGNLKVRANSTSTDEIGTLAAVMNDTVEQLESTLSHFEERFAERTADLEVARSLSEKRANQFETISEISRVITSEQKTENLLPLVARLISESFNFYHTGIFLVDNTGQFAMLQAASSAGGKNMLNRGHKLEIGGNSIVGYVAQFGIPRISLDVGQDAVYFNNPDLPNTRSEMALPLKIGERIIGALDVQSEKPGAFTQSDANTLGILADQVAISLENARLFTENQQALSEARAFYRQNIQDGWRNFGRESEFVGYRQNMSGGKKLNTVFESDENRQAMQRGEALLFHADGITQEAEIVVPIKLRGQNIGNINIKAPSKNRPWSADETNLAEVVSERLSVALENARLIQESQRQAFKEQQISEVTGKISASINLKNVLQTAVEELGRAMPGSDVVIQLKNKED